MQNWQLLGMWKIISSYWYLDFGPLPSQNWNNPILHLTSDMKTKIIQMNVEKNDINGAPQLAWPKVCEYQRVRNFLQPKASLAPLKDSQCRRKELTRNIILGSLLLFMPWIGNHFNFLYISEQRSLIGSSQNKKIKVTTTSHSSTNTIAKIAQSIHPIWEILVFTAHQNWILLRSKCWYWRQMQSLCLSQPRKKSWGGKRNPNSFAKILIF